jgi:hypothetical protein
VSAIVEGVFAQIYNLILDAQSLYNTADQMLNKTCTEALQNIKMEEQDALNSALQIAASSNLTDKQNQTCITPLIQNLSALINNSSK